jgi:hypothetical protein
VVGLSINASGTPHAFLRLSGEELIDLHTLIATDPPSFLYQACSINSRGELTDRALETSTGELHAFLAKLVHSEADNESAAPAEQGGRRADRKVALTENVRRQLQRLLHIRLPEAAPAGAQRSLEVSDRQSRSGPEKSRKVSCDPGGQEISSPLFVRNSRGVGNGFTINLHLQLRPRGSRPGGESSMSSGGDMTPPGLELNKS